jgi:DNA mismatch endonuclease (patch repair protein)
MADTFTKEKRSKIMRKVKSNRNKSTELKLVDFFKKYKITGLRRNYKLKGSPDFVFPKKKITVFTDDCFWHGHNCRNLKPDSNKKYWSKKNTEKQKEGSENK